MAELVLLSFDRVEILKLHCAANAGDGSAIEFCNPLAGLLRNPGAVFPVRQRNRVFPICLGDWGSRRLQQSDRRTAGC